MNNYQQKSLGIIIPAYNPDINQLEELIERIQNACKTFSYQILVVDDGSSVNICDFYSISRRAAIIRHPNNMGKGAALKSGFRFFIENQPRDLILTLDADLQHPPEYIPSFFKMYLKKGGNIIIGYRVRHLGVMPFHRILSNTLTSLIISITTGQLVRDSQCGFRLIESSVLQQVQLDENRFHLESELLLRAGMKGFKILSVPIPTIYANQKSSINHVADTLNFIILMLRIIRERL